jgi:hypothetical protein
MGRRSRHADEAGGMEHLRYERQCWSSSVNTVADGEARARLIPST